MKKINKEQIYNLLNEEHYGFAITLEVMATLVVMCAFINFTLYFLRVMNVQRYMNTVMTSTAAQASRWGGVETNAYKENVSETPLLEIAQNQLNYVVGSSFNPKIYGTPKKISNDGDEIKITIKYRLPLISETLLFSEYGKVDFGTGTSTNLFENGKYFTMSISVKSIMGAGDLL